jgi:hypothetical protein
LRTMLDILGKGSLSGAEQKRSGDAVQPAPHSLGIIKGKVHVFRLDSGTGYTIS